MRRLPILTLLLSLAPTAADAVPVTSYYLGTVLEDRSVDTAPQPGGIYFFTPGEAVRVELTYDPERMVVVSDDGMTALYDLRPATIRAATDSGWIYSTVPGANSSRVGGVSNGPEDVVTFVLGLSFGYGRLTLSDPSGTALSGSTLPTLEELMAFPGGFLEFYREANFHRGSEAFRASLVPTDDPGVFSTPEPSGLMLGLVGAALAGLGWRWRR